MHFRKNQDHPGAPSGAEATGKSPRRYWGRVLACLAVTAALASAVGPGQQQDTNPAVPDHSSMHNNQPYVLPDKNEQMQMREQQAKQQSYEAVNAQRKKLMADESALLLKLATDLKNEVDKTDKDTLSLSVIRKAETIEKLAHDVKEKMKLTVGAS
ncbi:MAG: hypothetical protein ABSC76_09140 [Terracidiphilus sp.]|jgi:hypothetical protein